MRPDYDHLEAHRHGVERSPLWHGVQHSHLQRQPRCIACRQHHDGPVQVHHIVPFHYAIHLGRPDLELDDRNLITLCETEAGSPAENHHLLIGHLGNFKWGNLSVEHDAIATFHGLTHEQIKEAETFRQKTNLKLKPLDEMSNHDKSAFRALMDLLYPCLNYPQLN